MLSKQQIQLTIKHFEETMDYEFKNPKLLIQALTRKSAKGIHVPADAPDFENLEFVGDRALNLAVTTHLRQLYPGAAPGELSRYYEEYTRNTDPSKPHGGPLYRVAKELELEKYIIKADIEDLEKNGARGKSASGKKSKEGHLSDHVEALIGALYEDSQYNMKLVIDWVGKNWKPLGLNEDERSESSFGESSAASTAAMVAKQEKQNRILLQAASLGNFQNAKIALERGASASAANNNDQNALHHFSFHGNALAIRHILDTHAVDIDALDKNGVSALLFAVHKGTQEAIEVLLEEGASVVAIGAKIGGVHTTALSLAASKGHTHLVILLLKYGWQSFSKEHIEYAIVRAKAANKDNAVAILQKSIAVQKWNEQMFLMAEHIIEYPAAPDRAISLLKQAVLSGANIYARNARLLTVFDVLKLMPVPIRFKLLEFMLDKKIRLDEVDLTGISMGVTLKDAGIVQPVYQQLLVLKEANKNHKAHAERIDMWLSDLSAEDESADKSLLSRMEALAIGSGVVPAQSDLDKGRLPVHWYRDLLSGVGSSNVSSSTKSRPT